MKKLLGLIIGLCMAFSFSVQAGAADSGLQVQNRAPAPPQQPRPSIIQQPNVQPTAQWVTYATQARTQNFHNASGVNNNNTAEQLKQFSQQTQQQMSDFSKL